MEPVRERFYPPGLHLPWHNAPLAVPWQSHLLLSTAGGSPIHDCAETVTTYTEVCRHSNRTEAACCNRGVRQRVPITGALLLLLSPEPLLLPESQRFLIERVYKVCQRYLFALLRRACCMEGHKKSKHGKVQRSAVDHPDGCLQVVCPFQTYTKHPW